MTTKAKSAQYTIRDIPPEVDRALRSKAAQKKQSLNQVVVDELTAATHSEKKRADFSAFVGRWVKDDTFDQAIAAQRQIDAELWR